MEVQVTFCAPPSQHSTWCERGLSSTQHPELAPVECVAPSHLGVHQAMGALGGYDSLDPTYNCPD